MLNAYNSITLHTIYVWQVISLIFDLEYWTKVTKRLLIFILTCLGIFLAFKLAIFYIPFLIAFVVSLMVEPAIKKLCKKTNLERRNAAIIVLIIVSFILIILLTFGIIAVISESSNLLQGLNGYIEKIYNRIDSFVNSFNFDKIKLPKRFWRNI